MSHYAIAGSGLEKMFCGQILTIFGIIPLIGWIAAIAGMVLFLVGLHEAAGADEGYRAAFYVEIAMLALSVLNLFLGVLGIFTSALSLVTVYLVCSTTSSLLSAKGVLAAAARGQLVWKIYVVCAVVSIICSILLIFQLLNVLGLVIAVPNAIASLVGSILYMVFLYQASRSLRY